MVVVRWWRVRLVLFFVVASLFAAKCVERNLAWTSQVSLWESALATHGGMPSLDLDNYRDEDDEDDEDESANSNSSSSSSSSSSFFGRFRRQRSRRNRKGGRVSTYSAHTAQNLAINLSVLGSRKMLQRAAHALTVVRTLIPEEDRVDTDEMYPTLALTLRLLGRWHEALEVLAEGWQRINLREDAIRKGIKIWHMHALEPSIEQVRRGRTEEGRKEKN